jgi:hypothetical protein
VQLADVELPGQYLAGCEVPPDGIIYLEGVGADVAIVRRNASSFRRLSLLCSDGHTRHMLVQVRAGVVWCPGCLALPSFCVKAAQTSPNQHTRDDGLSTSPLPPRFVIKLTQTTRRA